MVFLRRGDVQRLRGSEIIAAWPDRNSRVKRCQPARHQVRARSDQFHQRGNGDGNPISHLRITSPAEIVTPGAASCCPVPFSLVRTPAVGYPVRPRRLAQRRPRSPGGRRRLTVMLATVARPSPGRPPAARPDRVAETLVTSGSSALSVYCSRCKDAEDRSSPEISYRRRAPW